MQKVWAKKIMAGSGVNFFKEMQKVQGNAESLGKKSMAGSGVNFFSL